MLYMKKKKDNICVLMLQWVRRVVRGLDLHVDGPGLILPWLFVFDRP